MCFLHFIYKLTEGSLYQKTTLSQPLVDRFLKNVILKPMFFLFPVGSEEGVRRLPYVTIGLIVLNTIIYFLTSMAVSKQVDHLIDLDYDLREIETRYMYRFMETNPNEIATYDVEKLREQILEGDIIPVGTQDYDRWIRLYNEYQSAQSNMVYHKWGFTPKTFDLIKVFTSMFIHAGFFHLLFNMLYLWLVGCNIEDDWSGPIFLGVYFISGFFAVLLHTAFVPKSTVPLVGASGAIAGVMGAFMVRHFKTRVRFAYFVWVIVTRPFMGTFAVYAGVALPIWFLIELACAPGSGEGGTAHWAHIGGFVFGALVGGAMKFLHLEKKFVAPMVDDSFEKLKMSFKMKEATRKMDTGDVAGALPLLIACLGEEPSNFDAALMLARIHHEKGNTHDATAMYNEALKRMIAEGNSEALQAGYAEAKEKALISTITEQNIFQGAMFFEKKEDFANAAKLYGMYIALFPRGNARAKAIYRTYTLFKNKLNQPVIADQALDFLKQEYPDHPVPAP